MRQLKAEIARRRHALGSADDEIAAGAQGRRQTGMQLVADRLGKVDDGVATGSTMRAAVAVVRSRDPQRIVIAVPTAPVSTAKEPANVADDFVSIITADIFAGVGQWYDDFRQVSDEVTRDLYECARLWLTR